MKSYDEMIELAQEINSLELKNLDNRLELAEDEKKYQLLCASLREEILNEVDSNGKAKYSNDLKRNNAFIERKEEDDSIIELESDIEYKKKAIKILEIELSYLKNILNINLAYVK